MVSTPLWYHPSTVLLLDDEPHFVKSLQPHIDPTFLCIGETNPKTALEYLIKHSYDIPSFGTSLFFNGFNIGTIREALAKENKTKKVTVLVVDRHMPSLDGLELCRLIREEHGLLIKLILLTGATTPEEGIEALNAGQIDAYIAKGSAEEVVTKVNNLIHTLAWEQFTALGKMLVSSLDCPLPHLSDSTFCSMFEILIKKEQIVEFCILNESGSFLLLNKNKKTKLLLVCTEEDFEMMEDMASDTDAPSEVCEALKKRTGYPVILSEILPTSVVGEAWKKIMVPVQHLESSRIKNIYYQLVDEPAIRY